MTTCGILGTLLCYIGNTVERTAIFSHLLVLYMAVEIPRNISGIYGEEAKTAQAFNSSYLLPFALDIPCLLSLLFLL